MIKIKSQDKIAFFVISTLGLLNQGANHMTCQANTLLTGTIKFLLLPHPPAISLLPSCAL